MTNKTTDHYNPLIAVKEFADDGSLQIIHSYGDGGFRIAKKSYHGHQFLLPRSTHSWKIQNSDDISIDSILTHIKGAEPALLILGVGERPEHNFPDLGRALRDQNINLEVMSTPAACRTWNLLLSEGRNVAAGLLAIM